MFYLLHKKFLSTLPARGATYRRAEVHPDVFQFLSTLPARGATPASGGWATTRTNFYPRSPRGERPNVADWAGITYGFLSTLPARGATVGQLKRAVCRVISIHAPREGSDRPRQ